MSIYTQIRDRDTVRKAREKLSECESDIDSPHKNPGEVVKTVYSTLQQLTQESVFSNLSASSACRSICNCALTFFGSWRNWIEASSEARQPELVRERLKVAYVYFKHVDIMLEELIDSPFKFESLDQRATEALVLSFNENLDQLRVLFEHDEEPLKHELHHILLRLGDCVHVCDAMFGVIDPEFGSKAATVSNKINEITSLSWSEVGELHYLWLDDAIRGLFAVPLKRVPL